MSRSRVLLYHAADSAGATGCPAVTRLIMDQLLVGYLERRTVSSDGLGV